MIKRAGLTALILSMGTAYGQNMGGVFPPKPGESNIEGRVGYRLPEEGRSPATAWRIHGQKLIGEDFLGRVIVQTSERDGEQRFDNLKGELFWELTRRPGPWRTGVRFDATMSNGSDPDSLGFHWSNEWRLAKNVRTRFIVMTDAELGDRARDGIGFETRSNIIIDRGGAEFGIESFNLHGRSSDFDLFGGRQQVGPYAFWPIGDDLRLFTGVLFGANEASPDVDLRLWLGRSF